MPPRTALFLALGTLLACGSGNADRVLVLDPSDTPVQPGERVQFSLRSLEELAGEPEWEVQEHHGGAFLRSAGWHATYLAPQAPGTYHIVLHARKPDGSRIRQVERIRVQVMPTLEPATLRLAPGATFTFTARAKGLAKGALQWSCDPEGAITPEGLYTAPSKAGTYRVTVACIQDPEASATATVVVE